MIILRLLLLLAILSVLLHPRGDLAVPDNAPVQAYTIETRTLDPRARVLYAYLLKHNAPLANHSQDFVDAADKYNLDWRFVAAVSGVESTFGKHVPGGNSPQFSSFNGWGWGVYGTQALYFKNWREGIFTVSEGLRKNYFDQGLTEPHAINRKYAASPFWGRNVTYFLQDISRFESEYQPRSNRGQLPVQINLESQIAGNSATLALN